jgi:phosphoglycolate phosphatase
MNRDDRFDRLRLLVFDWDGTLIDSIDGIVSSLQIASKTVCNEDVPEQRARSVIGLGLREAIEALHPELECVYVDRVVDAYKQHYLYQNPIRSKLFPGVREMLEQLRDAGFLLAIATGKSRIGLDRALAEHGMAAYFNATRCAGESHSKPHPQMLLEILDQLNTPTQHALMIGDSGHDLLMASNAAVDSVGVTHGVNTAAELIQYRPILCLDDVTDLTAFLTHNSPDNIQPLLIRTHNKETKTS